MQLKEEFRTYDALRREHDAQIVQIATEAGLRIAPDQWSSLLYGDSAHKSHMQSIIDKLQTPQSFGQSVQELVIALQRTGDPHNLSNLRPSLELLAALDPSPEASVPQWTECETTLVAARLVVRGLVDFMSTHGGGGGGGGGGGNRTGNGGGGGCRQSESITHGSHGVKYKTSLCRDLLRGGCPRGTNCTFAHSEEELDKYRLRHRKNSGHGHGCSKLSKNGDGSSLLGSQENLAAEHAAVAMIICAGNDGDSAFAYANGCSGLGLAAAISSSQHPPAAAAAAAARPHFGGPATCYPYRPHAAGAAAYPPPPPLPSSVYHGPASASANHHMYGAAPPQPEYGMPAPIADYRPIETARLIPTLASQSLVVLQNRKQEILDQLEKIGSVAPPPPPPPPPPASSQYPLVWNAHQPPQQQQQQRGGMARTRTTASSAYTTARASVAAVASSTTGRSNNPEDDEFIPFDPPICSKYGPISRLSRIIPRPSNPVQASAAFGHSLISTQTVPRAPLTSTGSTLSEWGAVNDGGEGGVGSAAPRDFYAESERMRYDLEILKQQIEELKMATREASVLTEGRQRLARELHLIEENIREKERQLRLPQRKRRIGNLPVNSSKVNTVPPSPPLVKDHVIDWEMQLFTSSEDDEDVGIATGMRELELRLFQELEDQ